MVEPTTKAVQTVIHRKQAQAAEKGMVVMSLGEHLEELRRRLIYALLGLAPIFVVAMVFGKELLSFLIVPMQHALAEAGQPTTIQATNMFEGFGTYMQLALLSTVVVGFPWVLYQVWLFVEPGLYENEKKFANVLLPMSLVLTAIGVTFMYYVVLPVLLSFFVTFTTGIGERTVKAVDPPAGTAFGSMPLLGGDPASPTPGQMWFNSELNQIRIAVPGHDGKPVVVRGVDMAESTGVVQQPKVREYFDQLVTFSLAFAAAFQAPIIVLLLGWIGIVTPALLSKYRRHSVMVIAVVAAVLTPPDPISILLLAGPLWILFELGVLLLRFFPSPRTLAKERDTDDEAGSAAT